MWEVGGAQAAHFTSYFIHPTSYIVFRIPIGRNQSSDPRVPPASISSTPVQKSSLPNLLFKTLLVVGGGIGVLVYYRMSSDAHRIRQLEQEVRYKQEVIGRLEAERRVAEILVTDQQTVGGVKTTTLLFVEYDKADNQLPARSFTVRGEEVHVDALVVKFEHALVEAGDAIKGKSIALFTRIYGDATAPDKGDPIDTPDQPPDIYKGTDPEVRQVETALWKQFWHLAYDEKARSDAGVRATDGLGVHEPLRPGYLYTLKLEAAGGLTLQREELKAVYKEALKKRAG